MIASVNIQTAVRDGISYLQHCYFTAPFKIADITEDKKSGCLELMLMNASPGILDGDEYTIKAELADGTSLRLHTQSYQRLFNMKGRASQQTEIHLGKAASFCFLPHPTVPHKRSDFISNNKFYLSQHCTLLFGEVFTCGRKLNAEVFQFSKYHSKTEIFIDGKLVIKENLLIEPSLFDINAMGQMEGFTHQASLIYLDEKADTKKLVDAINALLQKQQEITFGVTTAPVNGLVVRILGQGAEQLHDCLKMIAEHVNQLKKDSLVIHAI